MTTLVFLYPCPESHMAACPTHFSAGTPQSGFSARGGYRMGCVGKKVQGWESTEASSCFLSKVLGWGGQSPQRSGSLEAAECLFYREFAQIHGEGRCLLPSVVVWKPLYSLNQASFLQVSKLGCQTAYSLVARVSCQSSSQLGPSLLFWLDWVDSVPRIAGAVLTNLLQP